MTTPEVRAWFDSQGDEFDWKSEDIEVVRNNLKRISDKGAHSNRTEHFWNNDSLVNNFIDNSDNLTKWIDRDNAVYLSSVEDEIREAETVSQLKGIDIDSGYEGGTTSLLQSIKQDRIDDISSIVSEKRGFGREAKVRIEEVTNTDELVNVIDELSSRADELGITNKRKAFGIAADNKRDQLLGT